MDKYECIPVHGLNNAQRDQDIDFLIEQIEEIAQKRWKKSWDDTDGADMLREIMGLPTFPTEFTIFIEIGYVDKIYRDIFYYHYASRHFSQPRDCLRLFFFSGCDEKLGDIPENAEERFVGTCVVQPNGIIGRSYWNPKYFLENGHYVRTSKYAVFLLGKRLYVDAFPYTMQDREATTCAEVTVLNLVDYYSQSYPEYGGILPSDIERIEAKYNADRVFPSQGMNYANVARSLTKVGLSPRIYTSHSEGTMQRYLYYYAESGIPFGVAVESPERGTLHSMVCIGHGPRDEEWPKDWATYYLQKTLGQDEKPKLRGCWIANSADAYQTFVVMDDNKRPYQSVRLEEASKNWAFPKKQNSLMKYAVEQLCVPLYKRVFLEVDGATEVFSTFLTSEMGFCATMERKQTKEWLNIGQTEDNPLIIRMFLAASKTFFLERLQAFDKIGPNAMDEKCLEIYQNLYCPKFVWVCELYSKSTFGRDEMKPIGEIVVDATARRAGSMGGLDSIVLVHYPHYISFRSPESALGELETNEVQLGKWIPFQQFRGNLRDFNL